MADPVTLMFGLAQAGMSLAAGNAQAKSEEEAAKHNAQVEYETGVRERKAAANEADERHRQGRAQQGALRAQLAADGQDVTMGQPLLLEVMTEERNNEMARRVAQDGLDKGEARDRNAKFEIASGKRRASAARTSAFGNALGSVAKLF